MLYSQSLFSHLGKYPLELLPLPLASAVIASSTTASILEEGTTLDRGPCGSGRIDSTVSLVRLKYLDKPFYSN